MKESRASLSIVKLSLTVLGVAATALTGCGQTGGKAVPAASPSAVTTSVSSTPTTSSAAPSSSVAPASSSPFQSEKGFMWITAACGSPAVIPSDGKNTLLPSATDWAICMGGPGIQPTLVGVYTAPSSLTQDTSQLTAGKYRFATHADGELTWIFLVESTDPSSLRPLERHGFVVH